MLRLSNTALLLTLLVAPLTLLVAPLSLLVAPLASAEEPADRLALLKTFREEFLQLTPGEGKYPAKFARGNLGGMADDSQGITFKRSFSIAKYEVPQNLWEAVMGSNPSRWPGKRNSAEMMTWDDAVAFCKKATQLMREAKLIGPKEVIRLPSEEEWEYAARAGTTTVYSFGDKVEQLGEFGWFTGNAAGNDPPVGAKKPNAWGLYDVHGYLWEFCSDGWGANFDGAPADGSPRTTEGNPRRVVRGGSWKDKAEDCRSASRRVMDHDAKDDAVGLRCVLASE